MKEPGSARSIHAPSTIGDRAAHADCDMMVPTIKLYSVVEPDLAHTEGDTHELSTRNHITNLIEKWEDPERLRGNVKEVEEGVGISSLRRVSQEFKNLQHIFEQLSQLVSPTEELSVSFWSALATAPAEASAEAKEAFTFNKIFSFFFSFH